MERAIDPLLTIDAKLWADEFMATKQRLGDAEFDHAMMLGWFANAIMQGYDEGQRRAKADAQATIAALQADNRTYINERHEHMKQIEQLQAMNNRLGVRVETLESQLTQRTAELEAAQREACLQREVEAALSSKVAEYEVELNGDPQNFYGRGRTVGLRTLIAALPKVEGEIVIDRKGNGTEAGRLYAYVSIQTESYYRLSTARFSENEHAEAYAAIWKHRQGMEG